MKTGFAMLVGAGVLSLAVGVGSATADVRHHHRHMAKSHAVQQAPAAARADYATFEDNHNPAKKYPTRQISENAVKTGTLQQNGNNPAKRYTIQHPIDERDADRHAAAERQQPGEALPSASRPPR